MTELLPCVADFVAETRRMIEEGRAEEELWPAVAERLAALLKEPALREHARDWPETRLPGEEPRNLLFYHDPDHGFVLNALIKAPNTATFVHDHGPSWTLYGVLEGGETVERLVREDDPGNSGAQRLRVTSSQPVDAGFVDAVGPWQIHRETSGEGRTVAFIVRSMKSGTFVQYRYDEETAREREGRGPIQVPYSLA